ncbi:hypothetical protein ACHAWF_014593 [Thalassiosira exigua]
MPPRPRWAPIIAAAACSTRGLLAPLRAHAFAAVGPSRRSLTPARRLLPDPFDTASSSSTAEGEASESKSALLRLLASVPSNESTPPSLTRSILDAVKVLEGECPTPDEDVLTRLGGNWELIWTAQDLASLRGGGGGSRSVNPFATFINPLENQSYSNNPAGRSNPILPRELQDGLEGAGILGERTENANAIKSTQAIDLNRNNIRNVVAFEANNPTPLFSKGGKTRGFITVDVKGYPDKCDGRKINVKFDRFRISVANSPLDADVPLGIVGPTGWLRTGYIDDDVRITRGHKGSVFVLSRTASVR